MGTSRQLGLDELIDPEPSRYRDLVVAMAVTQVIAPDSKLAIARGLRPIRHRTADRVRAHVFLRMLSYYLSCHLQARLAPLLFTDDDKPAAQPGRRSPVALAARSPRALAKAATKHAPGDLPVHSFTSLQRQAFELLGISHRLGVA